MRRWCLGGGVIRNECSVPVVWKLRDECCGCGLCKWHVLGMEYFGVRGQPINSDYPVLRICHPNLMQSKNLYLPRNLNTLNKGFNRSYIVRGRFATLSQPTPSQEQSQNAFCIIEFPSQGA
ncbi:hypothetical protein CEXT_49471 [Caerostris extrusa]|uniref:Uncharacterized protein n=1 Tax=Caerostris extrusa TaxID=172846 RepID=A0AAV4UT48_CAEEX|nr:hypothetical protein CEXT_49471 [Caerostris extrusa]